METHRADIVIAGGGIAGLWTANRLLKAGWNVLLLETHSLGGGQTLASQGILHSGVKYGIDGSNRQIADQLKALPPRWLDCLKGRGELDLSSVRVLAPSQFLWSRDRLLGAFTASMAGRALQGDVRETPRHEWPTAFLADPPSGALYEVREPILDIKSVIETLARPLHGRTLAATHVTAIPSHDGLAGMDVSMADGRTLRVVAQAYVFTAGAGNEEAVRALGLDPQSTQRRPLGMVMVRDLPAPVYGHCVTASPKPRVTITSHPQNGAWTWYLGGEVAEKGATMDTPTTIENACAEMSRIFPSIPWREKLWARFHVDRAEPRDPSGWLPPEPRLVHRGNAILAWPTKLVYAPLLADRVVASLNERSLAPVETAPPAPSWPQAKSGNFPWELAESWIKP